MKTVIIAEAGVNHNGEWDKAIALVDAAAEACADYVKFQTFKAEKLVSITAKKANYQIRNINDGDDSQFGMIKALEISEKWHYDLISYCKKIGIQFLSTGFDEDSIDFLDQLKMKVFKIPSGEITNKPYLQHIAKKGKPVILSTGMANLKEIKEALIIMEGVGLQRKDITVLHCNTDYPTPMKDVNLLAMTTIQKELDVKVGYSDHTLGIEVPIAAVALGASVIEKHFTLDRKLPGPDHAASLEPNELKQMVRAIRNIKQALGSPIKQPSRSEKPNINISRKSVHMASTKGKGEVLKASDLIMLRPGDGISPMQYETLIERRLIKDLPAGHKISWKDID